MLVCEELSKSAERSCLRSFSVCKQVIHPKSVSSVMIIKKARGWISLDDKIEDQDPKCEETEGRSVV